VNSSQRRWLATLIGTAACAVALCFAQLLVARAGWRADLSPEQRYVLSDHARNILGARSSGRDALLRADDARNREIDDRGSACAGRRRRSARDRRRQSQSGTGASMLSMPRRRRGGAAACGADSPTPTNRR
jgi:hypothetical protein